MDNAAGLFAARYAYEANGNIDTSEFRQYRGNADDRYRYAYTYDVLNRLTSADYSPWSGSAYGSSAAFDLPLITYDVNGNLLTLARKGSTGGSLDALTFGYSGSNNRLTSLTDAVTTAESYDAETGAFTHDASGNALTLPAPYSITATTYDRRNLPLTMTQGGTVT